MYPRLGLVELPIAVARSAHPDDTSTVLAEVESIDRRLGVRITVHLDSATTCVKPCHRILREGDRRNQSERSKQTFDAIVCRCPRQVADVQFSCHVGFPNMKFCLRISTQSTKRFDAGVYTCFTGLDLHEELF